MRECLWINHAPLFVPPASDRVCCCGHCSELWEDHFLHRQRSDGSESDLNCSDDGDDDGEDEREEFSLQVSAH